MAFTYAFYYLLTQGWSIFFGRWWLSLIVSALYYAFDYFVIQGTTGGRDPFQFWVLDSIVGLLGILSGSLLMWLLRASKMIDGGPHIDEFQIAAGVLQAFVYTLFLVPIASVQHIATTLIILILHAILMWLLYSFNVFSQIWHTDRNRFIFFSNWAIMLGINEIALFAASFFLPDNDQTFIAYFWVVVGIGAATSLIHIFRHQTFPKE